MGRITFYFKGETPAVPTVFRPEDQDEIELGMDSIVEGMGGVFPTALGRIVVAPGSLDFLKVTGLADEDEEWVDDDE